MTASSPPIPPKKGMSKMLIAIVLIAIVAIAAVAGAMLLMNNTGSNNQNDNGDGNGDGNGNGNGDGQQQDQKLSNGDFMEISTTMVTSALTSEMNTRWEVSNVTATGYDITIRITSDFFNQTITQHANITDAVGAGAVNDSYSKGTLVGIETLSTTWGNKKVEHWRITETDDTTTTVTDFYVGKDTKMVYKWTSVITDSSDPENDLSLTAVLVDTNIVSLKNGDKA